MVKDQHPAAVQEATASIIPVWLEAFKVLLDLDISQDVNEQSWDGLAIRKELFKVSTPRAYIPHPVHIGCKQTLDVLNTSFPKSLKPSAPNFLSSGVSHLQSLAPLFSKFYILEDAPSAPASSDDDSQLDLMQLVCPIFDFISSTIRSGSGKLWSTTENMTGLIEAVAWWVQITRDDVSCSYALGPSETLSLIVLRRTLGSATPMPLLPKSMTTPCSTASASLGLTCWQ